MKERLIQFVSIVFMVSLLGIAWAGSEHDGGHHGMHRGHAGMMHDGPDFDRIVEHMSRRLELDDMQEQAIRNIVEAAKPEADALHEQAKAIHEARRELNIADADYDVKLQNLAVRNGELVTQLTLLHGRVMAKVSAELSDEQKAKMARGRGKMHERFRHHRRSAGSAEETTT
jgi:Spy/CpxP family protein refolding chaperone